MEDMAKAQHALILIVDMLRWFGIEKYVRPGKINPKLEVPTHSPPPNSLLLSVLTFVRIRTLWQQRVE